MRMHRAPGQGPSSEPNESVAAIAARLARLRAAFGVNQAEFCRRTGIAQNTWNQYEAGRGRPALDFALRLKKRTGATLDWIFTGDTAGLPHQLAVDLERAGNIAPAA